MIIAINKPKSWTSFDVVNKIRHITHEKRVGHAGTLDPMAEGVLIIAIGRESTKQLGQLMLGKKTYEAEITLGATSTTDDAEGEISPLAAFNSIPKIEEVNSIIKHYVGTIQQIPPQFSAIKQNGKPAYKSARAGQIVVMEPRTVTINDIQILDFSWPKLSIRVDCQKGVYIRSLARDIGQELHLGGYLTKLIRTRVGDYTLNTCISIDEFKATYETITPPNTIISDHSL